MRDTVGGVWSYALDLVRGLAGRGIKIGLATMGAPGKPLVDIYIDLNGIANLGTVPLVPGRGPTASAADAWEYALSIYGASARLYRTSWRQLSTSLSPVQNTPTWRSNGSMPPGSRANLSRIAT